MLSVEGLSGDVPSTNVLRQRVGLLVQRFTGLRPPDSIGARRGAGACHGIVMGWRGAHA
jgi:hypothetical protein